MLDKIEVLDKGFIELIDVMGDDEAAVRAARVSYGKGLSTSEKDKKLIDYLMEHGHLTPFEHIVFTFHVKAPIFVVRQLFRHRIGVSYNEISKRYSSKNSDEFYIPNHIRFQDDKNKQGSYKSEDEEFSSQMISLIEEVYDKALETYEEMLKYGVAREMARMVLPVGQYTEFYFTVNARALMHFINLRADSHAQWEIQEYAKTLAKFLKYYCPWTYESFLKHEYKGDLLCNEQESTTHPL